MSKILELANAMKYQVHSGSYDWKRAEALLTSGANKLIKLEAENTRLRQALKIISGASPAIDNLMSDKDIARAALGEQTP